MTVETASETIDWQARTDVANEELYKLEALIDLLCDPELPEKTQPGRASLRLSLAYLAQDQIEAIREVLWPGAKGP